MERKTQRMGHWARSGMHCDEIATRRRRGERAAEPRPFAIEERLWSRVSPLGRGGGALHKRAEGPFRGPCKIRIFCGEMRSGGRNEGRPGHAAASGLTPGTTSTQRLIPNALASPAGKASARWGAHKIHRFAGKVERPWSGAPRQAYLPGQCAMRRDDLGSSRIPLGLGLPQFCVKAGLDAKLVMGALLHDGAIFENRDAVAEAAAGHAM